MFHGLAQICSDGLIGTAGADRSRPAWRQTYRALEHSAAKRACRNNAILADFPQEIQDFADGFAQFQEKRHNADYDPEFRSSKSEVLADVERATALIDALRNVSMKDKRAFAAHVLFKQRF
ncbi:hypothetical protein KNJ79_01575 [Sphingopyxis indica]|uniref:hypothetical protein n=1 Tax=Sphingopyxis indica TaxID=436663 RepID=UPI00293953F0|nr:hypothetical protein [Sphingopyxis indica]WOF43684.1 hypothetical protein KNJ79_01575 [Sphingopyxis indica]